MLFEDEPTYESSYSRTVRHNGQDTELVIKDTQGLVRTLRSTLLLIFARSVAQSDQEIFRNEYGLGYHGYVLVYSISSRRSLEILKSINMKLLNLTGSNNVPRVLVGNKADLETEDLRCCDFARCGEHCLR